MPVQMLVPEDWPVSILFVLCYDAGLSRQMLCPAYFLSDSLWQSVWWC